MNQQTAKQHGIKHGISAGENCEVGDSDRRAALCECVTPNHCEDCLTVAACENARQYSPFEFFAAECNNAGDRSEGLWNAYDDGVTIGIRRSVKKRVQRDVEAARHLQTTVDEVQDNHESEAERNK